MSLIKTIRLYRCCSSSSSARYKTPSLTHSALDATLRAEK
jgi:hypothetical protein